MIKEIVLTVLFLSATGLGAMVLEKKIAPLPKWTGPIFLYVVMPLLYIVLAGAIVVAGGYL